VNEEDPERDRATHKVSEHAGLAVGRRRRRILQHTTSCGHVTRGIGVTSHKNSRVTDALPTRYRRVTDALLTRYSRVTDALLTRYSRVTDALPTRYRRVTDALLTRY
jgi:hypothetical protein